MFEKDPEFKNEAILRWQVEKAAELLNISLVSIDPTILRYSEGLLYQNSFESRYGPYCWAGVKPTQVYEFRDSGKDLYLFQAYIGIKSIVGHKEFNLTHKTVILCRMFGCKSEKALQEFLNINNTAKVLYDKYSKRYWFDWLLDELEDRTFIMRIGYSRSGIYISTTIKDRIMLADAISKNKAKKKRVKEMRTAREIIQR